MSSRDSRILIERSPRHGNASVEVSAEPSYTSKTDSLNSGLSSRRSAEHPLAVRRIETRRQEGKVWAAASGQSLYGVKARAPNSDSRPLGDKSYITSCSRQVIDFLNTRGFNISLSARDLSSPSLKEFTALSIFLFRKVDGNFKCGSKSEDDVPTVFKQLRYPFQISKISITAAGSPHTWPSLLAALTWMIQILIYEEETRTCVHKQKHNFLDYINSAYQHFLAGDDETCNIINVKFKSTQLAQKTQNSAFTQALEQDNADMESFLKLLAKTFPRRSNLQEEKAYLLRSLKAREMNTSKLVTAAVSLEAQMTHVLNSVSVHKGQLRNSRQNCLEKDQGISPRTGDYLELNSTRPEEILQFQVLLESLKIGRTKLAACISLSNAELKLVVANLERGINLFKNLACALQNTKSTPEEVRLQPSIERCSTEVEVAFSTAAASRMVINGRNNLQLQKRISCSNRRSAEKTIGTCEVLYRDRCREADRLATGAVCQGSHYDSERTCLHGLLSSIMAELAVVEDEISSSRSAGSNLLESKKEALNFAQIEWDTCDKLCGRERLAVQNVMLAALDALMGHKQQVQFALVSSKSESSSPAVHRSTANK